MFPAVTTVKGNRIVRELRIVCIVGGLSSNALSIFCHCVDHKIICQQPIIIRETTMSGSNRHSYWRDRSFMWLVAAYLYQYYNISCYIICIFVQRRSAVEFHAAMRTQTPNKSPSTSQRMCHYTSSSNYPWWIEISAAKSERLEFAALITRHSGMTSDSCRPTWPKNAHLFYFVYSCNGSGLIAHRHNRILQVETNIPNGWCRGRLHALVSLIYLTCTFRTNSMYSELPNSVMSCTTVNTDALTPTAYDVLHYLYIPEPGYTTSATEVSTRHVRHNGIKSTESSRGGSFV